MYKVKNNSEYAVQANLSVGGPVQIGPGQTAIITSPHPHFAQEIGRVSSLLSYTEYDGKESDEVQPQEGLVKSEPEHPNALDKEPGQVIEGVSLTPEQINAAAERSDHKVDDSVPDSAVPGANQDGAAPRTSESNTNPLVAKNAGDDVNSDNDLNQQNAVQQATEEANKSDEDKDGEGSDADKDADKDLEDGKDGVDEAKDGEAYTREELNDTHWATIKSISEANDIAYTNKQEAIEAILNAGVKKSAS